MTEKAIQIKSLREQGYGYREISKATGINANTVKWHCRKLGLGGVIARKTKTFDEESKSVDVASDGRMMLIDVIQRHEGNIFTVKCRACGTERTISKENFYRAKVLCLKCNADENANRKKYREDAKLFDKDFKQLSFSFRYCSCGNPLDYRHIFCSRCEKERERKRNRLSDRRKEAVRIKRLSEHPMDKGITLQSVYERDKGICYICGRLYDWNASEWKDGAFISYDEYPSVDHVVPVALGGSHTWDNVRLACRKCNTMKGIKPAQVNF